MSAPLKIGLLAEPRYLAQAQPRGMLDALLERGHSLTLLDPEGGLLDSERLDRLADFDVLVARGRSTGLLARLGAAELLGVPTVNSRQAIAAVVDKTHLAVRLRTAGIPMPHTWIGPFPYLAATIPPAAYPLILKPAFGDNCRGIRVVAVQEELAAVTWAEPIVIAQHFIPNDGFDLKLYVIGDRVWAVRKSSPLQTTAGTATPCALGPGWRELARRCGELFGLSLYGVDCIETADGPQVIEINDFPNYTSVPEADYLLAGYVAGCATARRRP
jgi:ribosomal protein S6--L-glutamate ligase